MLREQQIPLPRAVIERALQESDDRGFTSLIERAFSRILDGTPGDRMALMQAALPLTTDTAEVYGYPCIVRSEQFRRLDEFCHAKMLNPIVLVAGAMMVELGMAESTKNPPGHCPTR